MISARERITQIKQQGILQNLIEACDEAAQNNSFLKYEVIRVCSDNLKAIQTRAHRDLEKILRLQAEIKSVKIILKNNELKEKQNSNYELANPGILDALTHLSNNENYFQKKIDLINSSAVLKRIQMDEFCDDQLRRYKDSNTELTKENERLVNLLREYMEEAEKTVMRSELQIKKTSSAVIKTSDENAKDAYHLIVKGYEETVENNKKKAKSKINTFKGLLGLSIVPKQVMDEKIIAIKQESNQIVITTIDEFLTFETRQLKTSLLFLDNYGFCEIDKSTLFIYGGAKYYGYNQISPTTNFHIINLIDSSVRTLKMNEAITHTGQCLKYKGSIFIFGGSLNGAVIPKIQVYNLEKNLISTKSNLPFAMHSVSTSLYRDQIFIAGFLNESIVIYSPDKNFSSTLHVAESDVTNKVLLDFFGKIFIICCKRKSIFFSLDAQHRTFTKLSHLYNNIHDSPLIATPAQRGNCFYFVNAQRSLYRFSVMTCELDRLSN